MRRKIIIVILFLILIYSFKCDYPVILILQEEKRGCDVIFTESYFGNPNYYNSRFRFGKKEITPNFSHIKRAEKIFFSNYNKFLKDEYKKYKILDPNVKLIQYNNIKKHFLKWKRQYVAYVDENNDTIIFIKFLDFTNKKTAKKFFEDWHREIFLCADGACDKMTKNVFINISRHSIMH